jgi:hypothetical protein
MAIVVAKSTVLGTPHPDPLPSRGEGRIKEKTLGDWCNCSRLLPLLILVLLLLNACGTVRPVPTDFNPEAYTPIDFNLLLNPSSPSLSAGQLVRCQAFFWEFLTYDPAPQYYYLNQLRYPARWRQLEWFAVYRDSDLKGYFDRGVMSYTQRLEVKPKRLEPFIIYGELVSLGRGQLYLQVHHLERIIID